MSGGVKDLTYRPWHLHGPGRAGTSLARLIQVAGGDLISLSGGGRDGAASARALLGDALPHSTKIPSLPENCVLLLGVPDDALGGVAAELANAGTALPDLVFHLSGARGRDVLNPLEVRGCRTAAFHPLRSFAERSGAGAGLEHALVAIEADEADMAELSMLARRLGGVPFQLKPGGRTVYHLAASLAGNAILGVLAAARDLARVAGVDPKIAEDGLLRLAGQVIANAQSLGLEAALTGPVARGDVGTLRRHEAVLSQDLEALRPLFRETVRAQLRLLEAGTEEDAALRVRAWLEEAPS